MEIGVRHSRILYLTFSTLIGLLALTIAGHFLSSGRIGLIIALVIASGKAVLIAVIFMDLRRSDNVSRIVATGGLVWLGILLSLVLADYQSRGYEEVSSNGLKEAEHVTAYDRVEVEE